MAKKIFFKTYRIDQDLKKVDDDLLQRINTAVGYDIKLSKMFRAFGHILARDKKLTEKLLKRVIKHLKEEGKNKT